MGEILSMHMWSERRKEVRSDTKKMVEQIADRYKSAYAYYLLQQLRNNMIENKEEKMLLSRRKWQSYNRPLMSGYLYILGGSDHRKWRRRFCVLQPDYTLEVYDSEEGFAAANKPRFSKKHSNFKVVDNVDAYISQSIKNYLRDFGFVTQNVSTFAKKLGLLADTSRRPTQHVLALSHPYRGTFFMAADTALEKEKWLIGLQDASRHLAGVHCKNEVECKAFTSAINKSCDAEEHCGIKCSMSGTQVEIITDFITDYLASGCKTMLQTKVKGNLVKKYKMWDSISKHLCMLVESMVEVEYPPLRKKAEEEAKQMKPNMIMSMPQISAFFENISDEINAALDVTLKPELESNVLSKLPEIVTGMADAMANCLVQVKDIFVSLAESVQQQVKSTTPEFANNVDRFFLDQLDAAPRNSDVMQKTFEVCSGCKSPLKPVQEKHPKFKLDALEDQLCVSLQELLDSSIYTFEMLCGEAVQKEGGQLKLTTVTKIQGRVLKKLSHDNMIITKKFIRDVMFELSVTMTKVQVDAIAKEKMHDFEDLVPLEFTDFLPVSNIYKDTVSDRLMNELKPVLMLTFKKLTNEHFAIARYQSCSTINSQSSAHSTTSEEASPSNEKDAVVSIEAPKSEGYEDLTERLTNGLLQHQAEEVERVKNDSELEEKSEVTSNVEQIEESSQAPDENGEVGPVEDPETGATWRGCMDGETGEVFKTEDGDCGGFEEVVIQAEDVIQEETEHRDSDQPEEDAVQSQDDVQRGVSHSEEEAKSEEKADDEKEEKNGEKEKKSEEEEEKRNEERADEDAMIGGGEITGFVKSPSEAPDEHQEEEEPPLPAPRKKKDVQDTPNGQEYNSCNDDLPRIEDLEKYSGAVEQIIQTGEEKLI